MMADTKSKKAIRGTPRRSVSFLSIMIWTSQSGVVYLYLSYILDSSAAFILLPLLAFSASARLFVFLSFNFLVQSSCVCAVPHTFAGLSYRACEKLR